MKMMTRQTGNRRVLAVNVALDHVLDHLIIGEEEAVRDLKTRNGEEEAEVGVEVKIVKGELKVLSHVLSFHMADMAQAETFFQSQTCLATSYALKNNFV